MYNQNTQSHSTPLQPFCISRSKWGPHSPKQLRTRNSPTSERSKLGNRGKSELWLKMYLNLHPTRNLGPLSRTPTLRPEDHSRHDLTIFPSSKLFWTQQHAHKCMMHQSSRGIETVVGPHMEGGHVPMLSNGSLPFLTTNRRGLGRWKQDGGNLTRPTDGLAPCHGFLLCGALLSDQVKDW